MDKKMSEFLRNTLLIGYLCVYLVESAENLHATRIFSKRPNEYWVIRRYYDISIAACEAQCMYRKNCRAVIYVRTAYICKLLWKYSANEIIAAKRTAYEIGPEEIYQNFSPCLDVVCGDKQTCIPTDNGNTCKYTECGRPPDIFHVISGNMFSLGNTVIVSAGSPNMAGSKITCGEDGEWHPVDSQCFPGWKKFGDACYWFDTALRTQADAQTYCENVIPNAYLADIKSDAEINFVANWLQQYDIIGFWMNGKYNTSDRRYYWADGTAIGANCWGPGEPNREDEHCMACVRVLGFRWADVPCGGLPTVPLSSLCKQHRIV